MAAQTGRRQAAHTSDTPAAIPRACDEAGGASKAGTAAPAFVGREDVLAAASQALDSGPCQLLIEGEAGIGKTRLVHELLTLRRDSTVLMAACPPLGEPFPLGPVVNGVRSLCDRVDDLGLSPLGGALQPLFPEWVDQLPPALEQLEDPTETRHRIFRALTDLVRRLGVEVLVVEDVHWADTATLEWLLTLTTAQPATDALPMSIVVSFRPDDVPVGSLLVRLTSRLPAGMERLRIELEPLDVEQTRLLVGSMLGTGDVSERFAVFLHENTDGVPLAVEESIQLMLERHDIIRRGGVWTRKVLHELEVPPTVRDSVLERVDRLTSEAQAVLRAAAILSEPANQAMLAAVADLDEEPARRGVGRALTAGLLRDVGAGRLGFRHVLDAKAVEEPIPASERWLLHRRAAQALERVTPTPSARLARHFREANDTEAWCRHAEAAADAAWESGNDRTAVVTLLELLTSLEHPIERRVRLARTLGEAAYFGANALGALVDQVVQVLRDVLTAVDLPQGQRGELRLLLGRMLWDVRGEHAAFGEFEAAVPDLGHRPDLAIRAMMNLALPHVPDWPAERHLSWLQRVTKLLPQVDSPTFKIVNRACVLLLLGEDAGWQAIDEIAESTSGLSERRRAAVGLLNVAEAILVWGRYNDARKQLETAVQYIEETDYRRFVSHARIVRAYLDWYTGTWRGLRDATAELVESDEVELRVRLLVPQILGLLDLASGARTSAERHLHHVTTDYERRGVAEPLGILAPAAMGRLYLAEGAAEEALQITAPALEMIARKGVWLWATDVAPVHLDALIHAARLAEAEALFAEFAAGVDGRRAPGPSASVQVCRAMLTEVNGDLDHAAALFEDAAAAWAALPRPYDELLALERQGHCLLTSGKQDEGLAVLSDAEFRLRELGARWDADRMARLLRRHGVEVPRPNRRGRRGYGDQLSPRELDVVELVARGMTNKQIGAQLFLSPKTVDRHLRSARRKLGASTRISVVMAAAEAGLLTSDAEDLAV